MTDVTPAPFESSSSGGMIGLEDMHRYMNAVIETINIPVITLDTELKIRSATPLFYKQFNVVEDDILSLHFTQIKNFPGSDPTLLAMLQNLIETGVAIEDYELNCISPYTKERYFRINARMFTAADGPNLLIVSINDITDWCIEKSELEKSKKHLEEKIDLTVESAELGTWEMNPETGKISWDNRTRKFFTCDMEDVEYEQFLDFVHPDDRQLTDEAIKKVSGGYNNGVYNIEYRTPFGNEEINWLKSSGKVYFDNDGKAVRFAGTIKDITPQKMNEQLLKESEGRFRIASDSTDILIWMSGPGKERNYFNKSWTTFTGRSMELESGPGWKISVHPDDLEDFCMRSEIKINQREKYALEYRLRHHDMEYRWISEVGAPRFSPDGTFEGYIGTCIDIHEQKMTREELANLVSERTRMLSNAVFNLEESNQNLEEFAYVASHDLQEPLRKIQAFATRLEQNNKTDLNEETRLYLSKITAASTRMSRLIGDLLNYSKLKNTDAQWEDTDFNVIIDNVLADFDLTIQQKKAIINVGRLPVVKAIPMRMNQLFHNLISNALKFSQPGVAPVIDIHSRDLSEKEKHQYPALAQNELYTVITFTDNGIGFDQEFAEKVFTIFQRLNGLNEYEGTGIGLAICKKIVLNHHGIIFAESEQNKGTKFHIIFPLSHNISNLF